MSAEEKKLQEEMIRLLLKRAELKKSAFSRIALKHWAQDKVDLFNKEELIYFKSIFI